MYLATRRIRSAGRSSGSIEITLPAELQTLEGIECHLLIRDGNRPEIVLQPQLAAMQGIFQSAWRHLRLGLLDIDEIDDFSLMDFTLTLFSPPHWQERPPLAYVDALLVFRPQDKQPERVREAQARLLASLALVAGVRLGLTGSMALAFGDAVPYCLTGISPGMSTDFERAMAYRAFWNGQRSAGPAAVFEEQVWQQAQPCFRRVYDELRAWQDRPESYAAAREKWHRALAMEAGPIPDVHGAPISARQEPALEVQGPVGSGRKVAYHHKPVPKHASEEIAARYASSAAGVVAGSVAAGKRG